MVEGNQEMELEIPKMRTDKTFTRWSPKDKKYIPVTHTVLPTSSFLLAICGKSGSGKSSFINSIFTARSGKARCYRGVFDTLLFIMNRVNMNSMIDSDFKDIPEENFYPEFDEATLQDIWKRVKKNKEEGLSTCLIIDDQINKTRTIEADFHHMCLQHRHWELSIVISIQDGKFLSPVLRNNLSSIVFFKNPNKQRELFLKDEYMSHLNNVEFQKVMKAIFQNFGDTLIINNRAHPPKFYRNFKELTITGYESEALD